MEEAIRFVCWEVMKALALVFLALLAAKAVSNLGGAGAERQAPRGQARLGGQAQGLPWIRAALYALIVALVILGARPLGDNWAAQIYLWASRDHLTQGNVSRAYDEALRAVQLRPGILRNWRALAEAKLAQGQWASVLEDRPSFLTVSRGPLDEEDAYVFAHCTLALGQYDQAIAAARDIIRRNPSYVAPYILLGLAYSAEKKYPEAERAFLDVLQMFPNNQAAVEGLAHTYFLAGNRASAVAVLDQTARYSFSAEARKRFEALKALYGK